MATPAQQVTAASEHPDPLAALPPGYVVRTFSNIRRLQKDAVDVLNTLEANGEQGNQFLVVRGLTKPAIERLDNRCLGVNYRFQWDGSVGIIKIIPGFAHSVTTRRVATIVLEQLLAMGIPLDDIDWGGNTTYKPQARTGKQADDIFWPGTRSPKRGRLPGWPTLVIETGMSESHPKLQADAKWWFANSSGDVRIVLLIVLITTYVRFEIWQLVPPNGSRPVSRAYIDQLRTNPERTHEVTVTATTVTGAPMTLPFAALYERPPGPNEGDVVITSQMFRAIAKTVV